MIHEFLGNGVELLLSESHFSRAVAIQCWVRTGSMHELPDERGMAHFIEHMLFKGTKRRAVGEIGATVESCGGDINAYTTFDRTVFYLTLASKHAEVGMDLLSDAIFNSSFDQQEFEREREVILEEIRRGLDDPGSKVGRRVFELIYEGSEIGRPIIGSEQSVRSFDREALVRFHDKWYRPKNMAVVVVGDFDTNLMRSWAKATFGSAKDRPVSPTPLPSSARPGDSAAEVTGQRKVNLVYGDFKQPRLEIAFPAPSLDHYDTAALDLAAFALGSGDLSRLNRRLRDQQGILTAASASVFSPAFRGVFEVSAFASVETYLDAVRGLAGEVGALKAQDPVTAQEIERARASLKSDRIYRDETVDGQARSLGFGLTTPYKQLFDEVYWTLINGTNEVSVYHACGRWLDPEKAIIVGLLPEGSKITEAEVEKAFLAGFAASTAQQEVPRLARASGRLKEAETEVIQINDGLKLVYKRNIEAKLFSLVAASEGGLRGETAADAGFYYAMSGLLAKASEEYPYETLIGSIEDLGASLDGFSGKDSFGMQIHGLTEQVPELFGYFGSCLLRPVFPTEQWESLQREILDGIRAQDDSPAGVCMRRFQELIFGDHPYRHSLLGKREVIEALDPRILHDRFLSLRDAGPWVIGAVGALPSAQVAELLSQVLGRWSPSARARSFTSDKLVKPNECSHHQVEKAREQTHITYGFGGITWDDPDRAALDVLANVLGGHGGRLFLRLRDRDSLAYTVSPIVSYGRRPGAVGSYIACAPQKWQKALDSLKNEMHILCDQNVTPEEIDRSKNYIIGSHEMDLQRGSSQAMTMTLMELYGIGHDDFRAYPKSIEKVQPADLMRVAKRLFDRSRAVDVVVGPSSQGT